MNDGATKGTNDKHMVPFGSEGDMKGDKMSLSQGLICMIVMSFPEISID